MQSFQSIPKLRTAIVFAVLGLCLPAGAQQVSFVLLPPPTAGSAPIMATTVQKITLPETTDNHRFWDRDNSFLFATSAAFSAADFVVTRDNLRAGGQELNPVVNVFGHSSAGLAMNFAGETVGVVGLSYFFHKTGHHKLERAVSMLNIGGSAAAVSFGMAHR
jgi:hypothetical protein